MLWNCEKEEFINETETSEHQELNSLQKITFEDLFHDRTFTKIAKEFEIEDRILRKNDNDFKSKGANNDFEIDTQSIIKIKKENYTSYTFVVKRNNLPKNTIENLIIEQKTDTIRGFFVRYKFSDDYIKNSLTQKNLPFEGTVQRTSYQKNINKLLESLTKKSNHYSKALECFTTSYTVRVKCFSGKHEVGENCQYIGKSGAAYNYTLSNTTCTSGGNTGWGVEVDFGDNTNSGGGTTSNTNNDSNTSINFACDNEFHGCDKVARQLASRLGLDSSLLLGLSEENLEKIEEIATMKEDLSTVIDSPNFDPLNDTWLKVMREFAKLVEYTKNFSKDVYDKLTEQLDTKLSNTLRSVAKQLYADSPSTMLEYKKEERFKYNGKQGVAILLDEFATGLGKDERPFSADYDITKQMIAGNVQNDIKADFLKELNDKGLTFSQFIANGTVEDGSYRFSPDHTGVVDSFNKHVNANWVQFFIGGASTNYYPSSDPGFIIVELANDTSRKSLLLHVGNSYDRDGTGNNRPLSTIKQIFRFKLQIQ